MTTNCTPILSLGYDYLTPNSSQVLLKRVQWDSSCANFPGTVDAQDRLLTYGSTSYSYTPNGELTSKTSPAGSTNYSYDVAGNLHRVTPSTGPEVRYATDPQNRRIAKYLAGAFDKGWIYQSQLRPVAQIDATGAITQFYLYAQKINVPSMIVRKESSVDVTYRVVSDHLGSVRLVINANTGVVAQRGYSGP